MKNQAPVLRQKRKVGVAGSFQNQMMGNNATLPEVGKYATELMYSDRHPYKVVAVSKDYKKVEIEYLHHSWDETKEGGMGHQNWKFEESGSVQTIVWKWGSWKRMSKKIRFTKEFREENDAHFQYSRALTEEQRKELYGEGIYLQKVIEGITEEYTEYSKISVIFQDEPNYHYDWSF